MLKEYITNDKLYLIDRYVQECRELSKNKERRRKLKDYHTLLESLLHSQGDNLIERLKQEIAVLKMG